MPGTADRTGEHRYPVSEKKIVTTAFCDILGREHEYPSLQKASINVFVEIYHIDFVLLFK
jgi:hypothetical protein